MNANAPRMNSDIDHTIDRALSALRDAEPRSGLNGRILTSLEHRNATPQPLRPHFSVHLALWAATSAAVLAIASLIILHRHTLRPNQNAVILSEARSAQSKNPDTARRTTNLEPFSTTSLSRITNTVSSRPSHRSIAAMRSGETCISDKLGCPPAEAAPSAPTDLDAQALADLHAPSHPAPPLPLTPQEKLFLRMLHYGNATQLAELDPAVRAKQDADETKAFKAFFPDPPPLEQPLGDTE